MNADSGKSPLNPPEAGELPFSGENKIPSNWIEAALCLVSSRIGIIQAEAKEMIGAALGKAVCLVIAAFCLVITWILVVVGAIGVITAASDWPWYHTAFAAAVAHALVAAIMFLISRSKSAQQFSVTRAEFEKDRQWLNQLKNQSNSDN